MGQRTRLVLVTAAPGRGFSAGGDPCLQIHGETAPPLAIETPQFPRQQGDRSWAAASTGLVVRVVGRRSDP